MKSTLGETSALERYWNWTRTYVCPPVSVPSMNHAMLEFSSKNRSSAEVIVRFGDCCKVKGTFNGIKDVNIQFEFIDLSAHLRTSKAGRGTTRIETGISYVWSYPGASRDFQRSAQGSMGRAKKTRSALPQKKSTFPLWLCAPTAENPKKSLGTRQPVPTKSDRLHAQILQENVRIKERHGTQRVEDRAVYTLFLSRPKPIEPAMRKCWDKYST